MEKVMVVKTAFVESYFSTGSFITENISTFLDMVRANHSFVDRDYAEYASEYKQIIPYAVLINGTKYYLTQRLRKQTEKRLHGMYSIGLGGHINPKEELLDDIIVGGMRRELYEEIGLKDFQVSACVGIINDHSADVSNYHIGLVYPIIVSDDIHIKEVSKMTGEWASVKEVERRYEEMETWSKIVWQYRKVWESKFTEALTLK